MKSLRVKLSFYKKLSLANVFFAIKALILELATPEGVLLFPNPLPTLAEWTTDLNNYATLKTAVEAGDYTKKADRDQAKTTLLLSLESVAAYCVCTALQTSANLAEAKTKLESVGFVLTSSSSTPVGPVGAPGNVRTNPLSEAIEIEFEAVKGALAYVVMKTVGFPTPNSVWEEVFCPRTKVTITNCVPGEVMSFKAYALGAAGLGQPSDYVSDMAKL